MLPKYKAIVYVAMIFKIKHKSTSERADRMHNTSFFRVR